MALADIGLAQARGAGGVPTRTTVRAVGRLAARGTSGRGPSLIAGSSRRPSRSRIVAVTPDRALPSRALPGRTLPGRTLPSRTLPSRTLPRRTLLRRTVATARPLT
jgi:hypothetical protein